MRKMKPKDTGSIGMLVLFIAVCQLAGVVGSLFTYPAIGGWYTSLAKPFFSPPNWVFGPVWVSLFTLIGVAAYLVWREGAKKDEVIDALRFFALQLALNTLWSLIFFGVKRPGYAFAEIIVLWIAIAATTLKFYRVSRNAAYLMAPYILWVSFAAVLNLSVAMLNP